MIEQIIPFKGKNYSLSYNTNLLFKDGNIFLMDNHKMALWCWLKLMDFSKKYNLIHIDKHADTIIEDIDDYIFEFARKTKIENLDANEFDGLIYDKKINEENRVFTWNNYLAVFYHNYSKNIIQSYFFVHEHQSINRLIIPQVNAIDSYFLFGNFFKELINESEYLIINIDIDYFFQKIDDKYEIVFSPLAINNFFTSLKKRYDDNKTIITLSLSPECCGNWDNSIKFIDDYFKRITLKDIIKG